MNSHIDLKLEILNKLGAPLMGAVIRSAPGNGTGKNVPDDEEARALAGLLANAVKTGLTLSRNLNISDESGSDSVRLALTGIASRLIGIHYGETGKLPTDKELKRMAAALEAVLAFADNFAPEEETALRLKALDPETFLADEKQVTIQYIGILVPVVEAVSSYSFGRPDTKLVQDVSQTLLSESQKLSRNFFPEADKAVRRRIELQLLKSLADLYVRCHEQEKRRLAGLDDKEKASIESGDTEPIDLVWDNFNKRLAMIKLLGDNLVPQISSAPPRTTPAAGQSPPQAPSQPAPQADAAAAVSAAQQSDAPSGGQDDSGESGGGETDQGGGGDDNPMSFFAGKNKDEDS